MAGRSGPICHKGLYPGSACYGATQTGMQRNAENPVLICVNHHDAIDAQKENDAIEVLRARPRPMQDIDGKLSCGG
jgi:hypothetical protein